MKFGRGEFPFRTFFIPAFLTDRISFLSLSCERCRTVLKGQYLASKTIKNLIALIMKRMLYLFAALLLSLSTYSQTGEQFFDSGNKNLEYKNFPGAISDFTNAIDLLQKDAKDYTRSRMDKSYNGDPKGAAADYQKATMATQLVAKAYRNRAVAERNTGNYQDALNDCNQSLELYQEDVVTHFVRGRVRYNLQDYQGAIDDFNYAAENSQDSLEHSEIYYHRGMAKVSIQDYPGAIDDFTTAISIKPQDAASFTNRGVAKIQSGQKESGCQDLNTGVELGDNNAPGLKMKYCR
jgi:tetratricopeptide (TPR) repeat protein